DSLQYGIYADSTAQQIGLQSGDKILTIDNEKVEKFNDITLKILLDDAQSIQVERNNQKVNITIPQGTIAALIKKQEAFIEPAVITEVAEVIKGSPAEAAGLKEGDRLIRIDGKETPFFQDVVKN